MVTVGQWLLKYAVRQIIRDCRLQLVVRSECGEVRQKERERGREWLPH